MTRTSGPTGSTEHSRTIFDLLQAYHRSLENMRGWLSQVSVSELERIALADAWQEEMRAWFRDNGYCFGCNREIGRCQCA